MKKRLVSMMLALCMVFSLMPAAFADGESMLIGQLYGDPDIRGNNRKIIIIVNGYADPVEVNLKNASSIQDLNGRSLSLISGGLKSGDFVTVFGVWNGTVFEANMVIKTGTGSLDYVPPSSTSTTNSSAPTQPNQSVTTTAPDDTRSEAEIAASNLHGLGLFGGVGNNADGTPNFDLDRAPTRQEAITMLVRLLGKEEEAKAGTWETPFTDVDDWAKPYVGYAYTNGLTTGTGADTFGGNDTVTATQYLTFILRALGYTSGTDFQWDKAWELSDKIELTDGRYNSETTAFTRGDVAIVSENMLSATGKENDITVLAQLVTAGAVTEAAADNYLHPTVKAKSLTLDQASMELTVGSSKTITATVLPEDTADKTLTWTSSDPTVATVIDGKVEALKIGATTIMAKTVNGISASCEVTAKEQEVTEIILSQTSASVEIGKSVTLIATVKPDNATNQTITWESSNTSVATVQDGAVRGVSAGLATITAKSSNGKTVACNVDVVAKPITFSGTGDSVITGINIPAGSYYAQYTYNGSGSLYIKLYYGEKSYDYFSFNCYSSDKKTSGQAKMNGNGNKEITNGMLEVKTKGNWTIAFIPVSGTTTTHIKGEGDIVTGVFTAPAARNVVTIQNDGNSSMYCYILKYDTTKSYDYENLSIYSSDHTNRSQKVINLVAGERYFIAVEAKGAWSVDFGLGDSVTTYTQPTISGGSTSSGSGSTSPSTGGSGSSGAVATGKDVNDLVEYISKYGTSASGSKYRRIQKTITASDGTKIVATVTYRWDDGLLVFHCNYDNGEHTISFDYDIENQKAYSRIAVSGLGSSLGCSCHADFNIATYTATTELRFDKDTEDGPFGQYASNYNEVGNLLVQIAVPAWGLLLTDTAGMALSDIGFTSY